MTTTWKLELLSLSKWALQLLDYEHRMITVDSPTDIDKAPGVAMQIETQVVFCVYKAVVLKGSRSKYAIRHEEPYPNEDGKNPRRADLAIKENGKGKNWVFIEVKCYGTDWRKKIKEDVRKLREIEKRCQRWILMYRVRPMRNSPSLKNKLFKSFSVDLEIFGERVFHTNTESKSPGICEIVLARVK